MNFNLFQRHNKGNNVKKNNLKSTNFKKSNNSVKNNKNASLSKKQVYTKIIKNT